MCFSRQFDKDSFQINSYFDTILLALIQFSNTIIELSKKNDDILKESNEQIDKLRADMKIIDEGLNQLKKRYDRIYGQEKDAAKCPDIVTQSGFTASRYAGVWYEVYRNTILFELGAKCVNATYTLQNDGSIGVFNQAINWFGHYTSINGTAKVKNSAQPGSLVVNFDSPRTQGDYNVISTNYDDYALVYSCRNFFFDWFKWESIWFLSRTKTLPAETVDALKNILSNMGVSTSKLKQTNQNC
ncbi:unnamed protein product [Rotaria sordida]|uniref:Apolipoprotein D n=1 Tax=Rotaria sordida TaxID=392033 RepID=A0A815G4Z4_9BILA|nr:unnamed protein product [Rotaria sordida]